MYTELIQCKNGTVTITKTEGNVVVHALAKHTDGRVWNWKNVVELPRDDIHELVDALGGTDNTY